MLPVRLDCGDQVSRLDAGGKIWQRNLLELSA